MVIRARNDNRILLAALAGSLFLHLLVALFLLPLWTAPQSGGVQPVEALSFARLIHVQIQRPAPAAPPVAMPSTKHHAQKVSFARHKAVLATHARKPAVLPTAVNGPVGPLAAAPRPVKVQSSEPLYARASAASTPLATTHTVAAPTPEPQATLAAQPVDGSGLADRGGVLPLGAEQDPVLDPGARARLEKSVGVHVTLLVTVGEDGKTKHVDFQPPIDPQLEREVESILADANWDAAVCGGGVSCQGVATIKL